MSRKSLPGQRTGISTQPRNILMSEKNKQFIVGGIVIDATYAIDGANTGKTDELRPGIILAKITASNLWVPCKRTLVANSGSGSGSTGATEVFVDDARHFKVGDEITINATSGKIIGAIDYTTNKITLTSVQTNLADGQVVYASGSALAGAEIARAILNEHVKLMDLDDGTWRDKLVGEPIIAGYVNEDMILGDLAAVRAATNYLDGILWSDRQGQT